MPADIRATEVGPRTLLGRLRAAVRARHYSPRTEESYVGWVKRFVVFHGRRHPDQLGEAEVRAFLEHLAERVGVSASTQNQAVAARFACNAEVGRRNAERGTMPTAPRSHFRVPRSAFGEGWMLNIALKPNEHWWRCC